MSIPDLCSREFDDIMHEAWTHADKYAVAVPWGLRKRGASDQAVLFNLVRESEEMRMKVVVHRAAELIAARQAHAARASEGDAAHG